MDKYLYVDDNPAIRAVFAMIFEEVYPKDRLVIATDYESAVLALNGKGPFAGIISDFNFPGPSDRPGGIDFLDYAQKNFPLTPFVFFSARELEHLQKILKENKLNLPEDHIFKKPGTKPDVIIKFLKERYNPEKRNDPDQSSKPPEKNF